jgi:hypothetical protein
MPVSRREAVKLRRISEVEVVALLKAGKYRVDPETCEIIGPAGRTITPVLIHRANRHWVRVYGFGGVRTITRSRIVWLSVTLCPLPSRDWEIHHLDRIPSNDRFSNLIALHKLDHRKLHYNDDPPF